MQQVTKTAREITKRSEESESAAQKESESDDSEDEDDEIIGPLPPPNFGMSRIYV